jgi:hypothetical protein
LTRFLDAVDHFFRDAGKADQTLFPHAFGLKAPAPLWTAPAFDRCLSLALMYPIAVIFIIWGVSGHVGPAEAALGLKSILAPWLRALFVGLIGVSTIVLWRAGLTNSTKAGVATSIAIPAISFALGLNNTIMFVGLGVATGVGFVTSERADGVLALSIVVACAVASGVGIALSHVLLGITVALFLLTVAILVVIVLKAIATENAMTGFFLSLHLFAMIIICFGTATWLPHYKNAWSTSGPVLLFVALLTLINAPFDWASLGLTRALLRRGLELGGWWPYLLALSDALAAAFIIALLAITMVIGVQTFDHLAEHSGGADARVLHLGDLFDGIAAQPSAPEYWWVYALLLSTMIPSLLNLMIGGASLLRGIPGLPALLLRFMPAGKAVPAFERTWLALVLTCQVFVGAFPGIAAQVILAVGVIFYVLPWMGFELLDTARAVAEADLPGRVLGVLWGNP